MTHNPSPQPYNNQQFGYEADFNDSKVRFKNLLIANEVSIYLSKFLFRSSYIISKFDIYEMMKTLNMWLSVKFQTDSKIIIFNDSIFCVIDIEAYTHRPINSFFTDNDT